jgi:hypothetical protein
MKVTGARKGRPAYADRGRFWGTIAWTRVIHLKREFQALCQKLKQPTISEAVSSALTGIRPTSKAQAWAARTIPIMIE